MKYIWQFIVLVKRVGVFVASIIGALLVYKTLVPDLWQTQNTLIILVMLWLFTAYITLPWVHRLLSRIYVPDYFIARSRTSDGILSDPIHMALNGSKLSLVNAFTDAGWHLAQPLTPATIWRIVYASVLGRSYPDAPVSDLFLFGKKQDLAFQLQVANNPRQRHHVRFWRAPSGWYLPGGYKVDWIGAASYDRAVGLSGLTSQITHKIEAHVDKERDFIIESLDRAGALNNIRHIKHFFPGYEARNGFGHSYVTDGSMVIADVKTPRKRAGK